MGSWLRVDLYNVRGLRTRCLTVTELLQREKLDVLVAVETFLERGQKARIKCQVEALCNERKQGATRAAGGVAILIKPGLRYEFLRSKVFRRTELVVIRVGGATLGAIYCPTHKPWPGLLDALEMFQSLTTGKGILLGDFNARHVSWCTKSTHRGRRIVEWAAQRRYDICTPGHSTHRNSRGAESTIDFALVKSGMVSGLKSRLPWMSPFMCSNHAPVVMKWWGRRTWMRNNDHRIHKDKRSEPTLVAAAAAGSKRKCSGT